VYGKDYFSIGSNHKFDLGDLYRQLNVQKRSVLSLFYVWMIQIPQTWCQIEAFVIRNELVFTDSL